MYLIRCTLLVSSFAFACLFSGSTPLGCYKKLIEYYKNGEISFQYVKTFNMDEYVGKSSLFSRSDMKL